MSLPGLRQCESIRLWRLARKKAFRNYKFYIYPTNVALPRTMYLPAYCPQFIILLILHLTIGLLKHPSEPIFAQKTVYSFMPLKLPTWLARLNMPPLTHWKVTPLTLYILVYVILYIYAYNGEERKAQPGLVSMLKVKQVPILVGTGTAREAAIGTSALIVRNQNFRELGSQILSDLHHLKKSISRLENQPSCLPCRGSPTELKEARSTFFYETWQGFGRNFPVSVSTNQG